MITNEQIQACQTALLNRQSELIEQVKQNNHFNMSISQKDSIDELSSYDNHPADMGTELYEREKDIALNEHAEKELEKINEALHAIEEGTYGVCSVCGQSIPFERLTVVPTTDRCTQHAETESFDVNRPVEEAVLDPQLNPTSERDVEQVVYDEEDAWQDVSEYGTSETLSDVYEDHDDEMYPNSGETRAFRGFFDP